ncbi:hypothetical protein MUK42_34074 [Musa troglodytarum]|uniref:Uncharacterized protein n=1 Tax=Musa troglodytarum TaxID=320322 RepID=A0A9E7KB61_9LILI|nr:hypothetical protein MUK42_34074 [Musa troglodytarum]
MVYDVKHGVNFLRSHLWLSAGRSKESVPPTALPHTPRSRESPRTTTTREERKEGRKNCGVCSGVEKVAILDREEIVSLRPAGAWDYHLTLATRRDRIFIG